MSRLIWLVQTMTIERRPVDFTALYLRDLPGRSIIKGRWQGAATKAKDTCRHHIGQYGVCSFIWFNWNGANVYYVSHLLRPCMHITRSDFPPSHHNRMWCYWLLLLYVGTIIAVNCMPSATPWLNGMVSIHNHITTTYTTTLNIIFLYDLIYYTNSSSSSSYSSVLQGRTWSAATNSHVHPLSTASEQT